MRTVFVDTSAFYAILDRSDPFHLQARQLFERAEREGWQLVTTDYVVHETWALTQARLGWGALDAFLDALLVRCTVQYVDRETVTVGAARCRQAHERRLSLTDCITFEFTKRQRITEVLADDEHFARAGLVIPAAEP